MLLNNLSQEVVNIKSKRKIIIQSGNTHNFIDLDVSTYVLRIMNNIQPSMGLHIIDCTGNRTNIVTVQNYPGVSITLSSNGNSFSVINGTHVVDCTLYKLDNSAIL